jgi:hypothetical protein
MRRAYKYFGLRYLPAKGSVVNEAAAVNFHLGVATSYEASTRRSYSVPKESTLYANCGVLCQIKTSCFVTREKGALQVDHGSVTQTQYRRKIFPRDSHMSSSGPNNGLAALAECYEAAWPLAAPCLNLNSLQCKAAVTEGNAVVKSC